MKLNVNEKTGKLLQMAILVAVLALVGLTTLIVTGYVDVALLGGITVFFATLGTVFLLCGALMMLRKTERSISVGEVLLIIGSILVILALCGQFGLIPGMT